MAVEYEALSKRIDKCEEEIRELKLENKSLDGRQVRVETKLDYITDQIKEMSNKIDKILERPVKRWDNIKDNMFTALATAAITGLATVFFMRG